MIVRVSLLLCTVVLSACGGAASISAAGTTPAGSQALPPTIGALANPTPIPFSFQTVDDPSSNVNAVTGINLSGEIVGNVGAGTGSSPIESYSSSSPYTSFQSLNYRSAQGTVATGLTSIVSNPIVAGYIINPPQLPGIWGFVRINGLYTLLKDHKEGSGKDAVTEVLGINDAEYAVGFFINPYGFKIPVMLTVQTERWTPLKPPGAVNAEATGINTVNDISGWESTKSATVGFFEKAGGYYTLSYPGAQKTLALSLNSQDQVVGYYLDSNGMQHGFLLTNPKGGTQQIWQKVDEPNAVEGTVVTGINDLDDISGYYIDGSGVQHGFVAIP